MISDRLLTEVQRQEKYLRELPSNFEFPLFNSKRALESQRRNGYRHTASAACEIVDNAIEAGAKRIHVIFDSKRSKGGRELVTNVAFIDDGSGMIPNMIRFALTLGGGTHFDDPNFIGKFGFGLPNSSINQALRVEVYSRIQKSEPIMRAVLDVTEVSDTGLQSVNPPEKAELPDFVRDYMKRAGLNFDHGTVVVWVAPDRLTYRTVAPLKEHLLQDFGITYRYLLEGDLELIVEGKPVEIVDPLFLDPRGRYYLPPDPEGAVDKGGAVVVLDRSLVLKYFKDVDTGTPHLERVKDLSQIDESDPNLISYGPVHLRVARLPYGFATDGNYGNDEFSVRRLEIRQSRRGMSFVRVGREIETLSGFPLTARDRSNGLGYWPTLQGYAYHWGVEIRFGPELDEVFGITNDKQRVRPIEDFWRVMAKKKDGDPDDINLDEVLRRESQWQHKIRTKKKNEKETAKREALLTPSLEPTPAEQAAAAVDVVTGRGARVPTRDASQVQERTEEKARSMVGVSVGNKDEADKALKAERKRRPYKVEYYDDGNTYASFYDPQWGPEGQVVVRVNRRHPFFLTLYGDLVTFQGGLRAKESVDLLLIALAKAELETDVEQTRMLYETQRREVWSPFLAKGLSVLAQTLQHGDREVEQEEPSAEDGEEAVAVV